ncbi:hypothetical protein BGZ63DRAFT_408222 [Mariannaea sp. PMI_226]|nr:hypothetical protein BGZ63DRAFT_408222 [Mariannaea sp. PMI_226]
MLQPKDSISIAMMNSEATIHLLEECLPYMEDLYLRCAHGEPWCFVTMYAAVMLLKVHIRGEALQPAKILFAQRFLDLYYRQNGKERISLLGKQQSLTSILGDQIETQAGSQPPMSSTAAFPMSSWLLDSNYPDFLTRQNFDINPFTLNMEFDTQWESFDFNVSTQLWGGEEASPL